MTLELIAGGTHLGAVDGGKTLVRILLLELQVGVRFAQEILQ